MIALRFTRRGRRDLEAMLDFYSQSESALTTMSHRFEEALDHLQRWPASGHRRRDLTSKDILFWTVRPYLVLYTADRKELMIIAIVHGARDLSTAFRSSWSHPG